MQNLFVYKYAVLFAFALFLSVLLNTIFLKFSRNLGRRDQDDSIVRWSSISKPSLGGISFYIIFLVTYSVYTIFFNRITDLLNIQHIGILVSASMAFLMGLSDDAYNTNPLLKFLVQVACGAVLFLTGTYISLFANPLFDFIITVLWVVAVMNSINMLDNMDAITTTVSIFIIFSAMSAAWVSPSFDHFFMTSMVGVCGALIGFLFYNWNPSKMFMGDTGSQFLGIFLASMGIIFFWNNNGLETEEAASKQLTITILAFIVPIVDTATVIINRLRRGSSPFVGGKDHTTHNLSYLGLSDKSVARVFAMISFVSYLLIYIIVNNFKEWSYLNAACFLSYFVVVFGVLYYITRLPQNLKKLQ
ncbi:MAG: undecaprenyl/decaprenyl-phosphate alpha-N-acetylglucosaminyl 1-phosphate transferase [Flavobacteriales bacterium]|nr:undecaprenyl/decaprenyl-phosphate alpha-N-acetylglucosaminyl 1-phosphate transferase [Flavobacteriales bacterium]